MKSLGENPMPESEKLPVIPDDPEQSKRFEEAARLLGSDETGDAFKRAMGVVVKHHVDSKSNEPLTSVDAQTIVATKRKNTR